MSHRVKRPPPRPSPPRLTDAELEAVAEISQAFATPSRLRILLRLWDGPAAVGVLAADIAMEPSAVSHQLRLLRHLGLVRPARNGREIVYALRDDHVASMLGEAIYHVEHLRGERLVP
jgi:DNA-binding transcriptional ArsR family regulator